MSRSVSLTSAFSGHGRSRASQPQDSRPKRCTCSTPSRLWACGRGSLAAHVCKAPRTPRARPRWELQERSRGGAPTPAAATVAAAPGRADTASRVLGRRWPPVPTACCQRR
eukprot:scaffold810_cov363-Prasinococcus_capsulatus_cf.AAC.4